MIDTVWKTEWRIADSPRSMPSTMSSISRIVEATASGAGRA